MALLRKARATAFGISADAWRLEAVTIRRGGKVTVELNGYLVGANLGSSQPVRSLQFTLNGAEASAVRAQIGSMNAFEAAALNGVKATVSEFTDATLEP